MLSTAQQRAGAIIAHVRSVGELKPSASRLLHSWLSWQAHALGSEDEEEESQLKKKALSCSLQAYSKLQENFTLSAHCVWQRW